MDLNDFIPSSDEIVVTLKAGKGKSRKDILNPDGSPMQIVMYATHTKEYKQAKSDLIVEYIKIAEQEGDEDLNPDFSKIFALITKSWNITIDGKTPELSVEKAQEIYEKVPIIVPQLDKALSESEVFI